MVKENSFEARSKKNRKRSSILKMSDLRNENSIALQKDNNKVKEVLANREVAVTTTANENVNSEIPTISKVDISESQVLNKEAVKNASVTDGQVSSTENPSIISNENTPDLEVKDSINQTPNDSSLNNNESNKKLESSITEQEISNNKVLENLLKDKDNFFNLNVKNDVFVGKMTTIRVYNDILETIKEYASMKNYNIIDFTNKVITLGLDDINSFGIVQITEVKLKNTGSKSIMYNLTEYMEEKLTNYINSMNEKGYKVSRNLMLNVILNETLKKFHK